MVISSETSSLIVRDKKSIEKSEMIINKWFCPINPISQIVEHFYKQRQKN